MSTILLCVREVCKNDISIFSFNLIYVNCKVTVLSSMLEYSVLHFKASMSICILVSSDSTGISLSNFC